MCVSGVGAVAVRNEALVSVRMSVVSGKAGALEATGTGAEMVADMTAAQVEMFVTVTPLTAPL